MTPTPTAERAQSARDLETASGASTALPLPLRFEAPPGWPGPEAAWVSAMQGWEPPVGWVPAPGLPAAPAGHAFWRPDPDRFPVEERVSRTQGGNRIGFGIAAVVVVGVLLVGQVTGRMQLPPWVDAVLVPAVAALGVMSILLGAAERRRATRTARAVVAQTAAEHRAGRVAVPYLLGAPPFGAVGNEACPPEVATLPWRVRRRSRAGRRGAGRSWLTVVVALAVAAVALVGPSVVVIGGPGPLVAFRAPGSAQAAPASARHTASPADRPVRVVTVAADGRADPLGCVTACSAWDVRATVACPAAVAQVQFGTRFGSARPKVVRTVERPLGSLAAGSVTRYVEQAVGGQQARIRTVRCNGAPGPRVTVGVTDGDDDSVWSWTVTPQGSCAAATIGVVLDEAGDGGVTRIVTVEPLTAGVPVTIAYRRPPGAVTAAIAPITC